jgi:hypothetical protein
VPVSLGVRDLLEGWISSSNESGLHGRIRSADLTCHFQHTHKEGLFVFDDLLLGIPHQIPHPLHLQTGRAASRSLR